MSQDIVATTPAKINGNPFGFDFVDPTLDDELDAQEQKELDRLLANTRESEETYFKFSDDFQRFIIGCILKQEQVLKKARQMVRPFYFTENTHRTLCKIAFDYFDEFGTLPDKLAVKEEIAHVTAKMKAEEKYLYTAETECCYRVLPTLETLPNLYKKLSAFSCKAKMVSVFNKFCADVEAGSMEWNKIDQLWDESKALRRTIAEENTFTLFSELNMIAELEQAEWIIPNWLEFGTLNMLTGLPFSGKSSLVAETIAAVVKGGLWCDIPTNQCPIVLIDLENKPSVFIRRMERALGDDQGDIEKLFYHVKREAMTLPLSVDAIDGILAEIEKQPNYPGHCLLIVDTMRSAFTDKSELDNDDMRELLYPLQQVAQSRNAAILVLHHNTKGKDQYAGVGVVAGACDTMWNWTRNGLKATLSMITRGDVQPNLEFLFDMGTQRNEYIGASDDLAQVRRTEEVNNEVGPVLRCCSDEWKGRGSVADSIAGEFDVSRQAATKRLKKAEDRGYLERRSIGERKHEIRLTDKGQQVAEHYAGLAKLGLENS